MLFCSDIETLFPGTYHRHINARRLTTLCDSFHTINSDKLDTVRKDTRDGELVTAARLKTEYGETIFFTDNTTFSDLVALSEEAKVAA
jgi:hypothetical protein